MALSTVEQEILDGLKANADVAKGRWGVEVSTYLEANNAKPSAEFMTVIRDTLKNPNASNQNHKDVVVQFMLAPDLFTKYKNELSLTGSDRQTLTKSMGDMLISQPSLLKSFNPISIDKLYDQFPEIEPAVQAAHAAQLGFEQKRSSQVTQAVEIFEAQVNRLANTVEHLEKQVKIKVDLTPGQIKHVSDVQGATKSSLQTAERSVEGSGAKSTALEKLKGTFEALLDRIAAIKDYFLGSAKKSQETPETKPTASTDAKPKEKQEEQAEERPSPRPGHF